jgi:hypothetical protein
VAAAVRAVADRQAPDAGAGRAAGVWRIVRHRARLAVAGAPLEPLLPAALAGERAR